MQCIRRARRSERPAAAVAIFVYEVDPVLTKVGFIYRDHLHSIYFEVIIGKLIEAMVLIGVEYNTWRECASVTDIAYG